MHSSIAAKRSRVWSLGSGVPPERVCGSAAGQESFLFLRKKKRFLTPRHNKFRFAPSPCGGHPLHAISSSSPHKSCAFARPPSGGGSSKEIGTYTAVGGFRISAGTPPGRYGLSLWRRDGFLLYPPAACGTSRLAECPARVVRVGPALCWTGWSGVGPPGLPEREVGCGASRSLRGFRQDRTNVCVKPAAPIYETGVFGITTTSAGIPF